MSVRVNGRRQARIDARDRGFAYGDGLFETMRVRDGRIRLLDLHLERLYGGCRRLGIGAPPAGELRGELERCARPLREAALKLIVTRGVGARGYRPSGNEHPTRVLSTHPLPALPGPRGVRVRLCAMRIASNPALAGLKTLNRLESVLARLEWHDPRVWEGLMRDAEGFLVCGTLSNFFVRRGSLLLTPRLDRCGIAGVMRRWVLEECRGLGLEARETRLRWADLARAEEIFMTNALAGVVPVARLEREGRHSTLAGRTAARRLAARLESL